MPSDARVKIIKDHLTFEEWATFPFYQVPVAQS